MQFNAFMTRPLENFQKCKKVLCLFCAREMISAPSAFYFKKNYWPWFLQLLLALSLDTRAGIHGCQTKLRIKMKTYQCSTESICDFIFFYVLMLALIFSLNFRVFFFIYFKYSSFQGIKKSWKVETPCGN